MKRFSIASKSSHNPVAFDFVISRNPLNFQIVAEHFEISELFLCSIDWNWNKREISDIVIIVS